MGSGLTVSEAARTMDPPIPRRELARRLRQVAPVGRAYGRRGRRPHVYSLTDIYRAHAEWVRDLGGG